MKAFVGHFPAQPHCFEYGGFDIQMNRVIDLLNQNDIYSTRVNPWNREQTFDVAHLWGGDISHSITSQFCKARGIPRVFSVLLPNPPIQNTWWMIARGIARRTVKGRVTSADCEILTVINEQQAWVANKVLGVDKRKIRIVPTIVDDAFFCNNDTQFPSRNSVLCVGTIGPRKNQLRLLQAAKLLNLQVILCGRFDDSHPHYRKQINDELSSNRNLFAHYSDIASGDLVDLYKQSSIVACVSLHETEPASVLEAMILQRKVVVSNRSFGRNPKFVGSILCEPTSVESIRSSLQKSIEIKHARYPNFQPHIHQSEYVIEEYRSIYLNFERSNA